MTNREYITQKLAAFQLNDAILADLHVDLDAEYSGDIEIGKAVVSALEELILAPYLSNVSESGFSVSWDKSKVGDYYYYLCRKYGIVPKDDILALLGVSMITDISDIW